MTTEAEAPLMPCRWCQRATSVPTLSHYGGRCYECHETYVHTPLARPSSAPGGRANWAETLRSRELAGERLSVFQRQSWRIAMDHEPLNEGDAQ